MSIIYESQSQESQESQESQTQNLLNLSYVVINNSIQFKMDKIADVYIHGLPYFTVFRRYNSPYEFVLEDMNGDTYLHKDQVVRESLQSVLCLSSQHAAELYTASAYSYKHNAPLSAFTTDLVNWHWSEIQNNFGAVSVDLGGILLEFQEVCEHYAQQSQQGQEQEQEQEQGQEQEPLQTPVKKETPKQAPHAPLRPVAIDLVNESKESKESKNEIVYPDSESSQESQESQETQYSEADTFAIQDGSWSVLVPNHPYWTCYCQCVEDDADSEPEEDDADYMVLRNGTRIRKAPISQKNQKRQKRQKC